MGNNHCSGHSNTSLRNTFLENSKKTGAGLIEQTKQKVGIFVDVQNVYYTVKQQYSGKFDYTKFLNHATQSRHIVTAKAYAIDRNDPKQQGFQSRLREIGFEVCLKPFISRRDGSSKGDWDVGITIDLMDFSSLVDVVVLVSGDGDFDLALKKISAKFDVKTEVYGVQNLTAESLISSADRFFPIDDNLLMQ